MHSHYIKGILRALNMDSKKITRIILSIIFLLCMNIIVISFLIFKCYNYNTQMIEYIQKDKQMININRY